MRLSGVMSVNWNKPVSLISKPKGARKQAAGALPALQELYDPDEADSISDRASEEARWKLDAALHQR